MYSTSEWIFLDSWCFINVLLNIVIIDNSEPSNIMWDTYQFCALKSQLALETAPVVAVQADAGVTSPVAVAALEGGVCRWNLLPVFMCHSPFV